MSSTVRTVTSTTSSAAIPLDSWLRLPALVLALGLLGIACSDDGSTGPSGDVSAPAAVEDLSVVAIARQEVTLSWHAPGDNGQEGRASQYDLRVSNVGLDEATFASADRVSVPRLPGNAGRAETLTVALSGEGLRYFALKTADEVPNWSPISNVATAQLDVVVPDAVDDLSARQVLGTSVVLTWTAPDGGDGLAAESYDLRYAVGGLTEANWEDAVQVAGVSVPGSPGSTEEFVVVGLVPNIEYSFGLKSSNTGAVASLSNVIVARTVMQTRLTVSTELPGAAGPAWSPSGDQIVFHRTIRSQGTIPSLYWIDKAGGEPVQISYDDLAGAQSPEWAPSGKALAFGVGPFIIADLVKAALAAAAVPAIGALLARFR